MKNKQGFDSDGFPLTAGGEQVSNKNFVSQDKYVQERRIIDSYNQIQDLTNQLNHNGRPWKAPENQRERVSVNRDKIRKMRNSLKNDDYGQEEPQPRRRSSKSPNNRDPNRASRRRDSNSPKKQRGNQHFEMEETDVMSQNYIG